MEGQPVRDIAWRNDTTILSLGGENLWSSDLRSGRATLVAAVGAGAGNLTVAPDGSSAAFVRDGDLWLVDLSERSVRAATSLGIPSLSSLPRGRYSRAEREVGPGICRLRFMVHTWIEHIEYGGLRGGCFFSGASAEFDGRPGDVRNRLVSLIKSWVGYLEQAGHKIGDFPHFLLFSQCCIPFILQLPGMKEHQAGEYCD